MKKILCILAPAVMLSVFSCKKSAGEGGTSSITGKVYANYYDKRIQSKLSSGYAPREDVFIIYGDDVTYGDNQKTNYDGTFEFRYLQKGKYKVYAYTRDSSGAYINQVNQSAPNIAVIKEVEITSGGKAVNLDDISIIK